MEITNEIFSSYLDCRYKGYLRSIGKSGVRTEFENLNDEILFENRNIFFKGISSRFNVRKINNNFLVSLRTLKSGFDYLFDVSIQNNDLSSHIDALAKTSGKSFIGDFSYEPILILPNFKVSKSDRLLLTFNSFLIETLQKKQPQFGKIIYANSQKTLKVHLNKFLEETNLILREIRKMLSMPKSPEIILNKHCQVCEFKDNCNKKVVEDDGLSLLKGMKEKEIIKLNKRGIFTVTQLSYTFRPRRVRKKVKKTITRHFHSLKALAIREKKIYIYIKPELPNRKVKIYIDIEGDPDRNLFYLMGAIIDDGKSLEKYSFWVDNECELEEKIVSFLYRIGRYKNFVVFHYGSYEINFFNSLEKIIKHRQRKTIKKIISNSVNVLSVIYTSIYFPTYSNELKEIANYLGFDWSVKNSSGIQSIIWRRKWERNRNLELKDKLILYNIEDCLALKKLTEFIDVITGKKEKNDETFHSVNHTDEFKNEITQRYGRHRFGNQKFILDNFDYINQCAYFDYQRNKIYIKTNKSIGRAKKWSIRLRKFNKRVNQEINIRKSMHCPYCKSKEIIKVNKNKIDSKIVVDLKFFTGGIKKWIIKYNAYYQKCQTCGRFFFPKKYKNIRVKYGHALISWVVYQNIVNGISFEKIDSTLADSFQISVGSVGVESLYRFKILAAEYYRKAYNRLVSQITDWNIIHIDETKVRIQGEVGYVWVFTNMLDVFFVYTETRKTDFIPKLLKDFNGVLISDFYKGYDNSKYKQQKCLIHLIRDINDALFKYQQNEELIYISTNFSILLRKIIDTINIYGLKGRHLYKHNKDVDKFYEIIKKKSYDTEVALKFIKRFNKYRDSLFTFLNHDEVPWNNNNAEHAFKHFVRYRNVVNGVFTERGINRYLILLSIYQTCKYRNIDFLKFLLSREKYIEKYCEKYTLAGNKRIKPRTINN